MDAREVPGGGWEWGRSMARADLEAPTLAFQQGQKGRSKTKLKNKLLVKNKTKQNNPPPQKKQKQKPRERISLSLSGWYISAIQSHFPESLKLVHSTLASLKGLRREAPAKIDPRSLAKDRWLFPSIGWW